MLKKQIYITYQRNVLQSFFAMMAIVEKEAQDTVFLISDSNRALLEECAKKHPIKFKEKSSSDDFKSMHIEISHSEPTTKIFDCFSAPLIFPKLIRDKFNTPINSKIDKIYFRGKWTLSRAIDMFKLAWNLNEFKALFSLLLKALIFRHSYTIETSKLFIIFTKRGRTAAFKYIDEDYFTEMSKYKYVYCSPGDYIWTYRFYETMQVGSIPIALASSKYYHPFSYIKDLKDLSSLKDDQAIADQNQKIFEQNYYFQ